MCKRVSTVTQGEFTALFIPMASRINFENNSLKLTLMESTIPIDLSKPTCVCHFCSHSQTEKTMEASFKIVNPIWRGEGDKCIFLKI